MKDAVWIPRSLAQFIYDATYATGPNPKTLAEFEAEGGWYWHQVADVFNNIAALPGSGPATQARKATAADARTASHDVDYCA